MLPDTPGYTILRNSTGEPIVVSDDAWGTTYKAFHHALVCHVALKPVPRSRFAKSGEEMQFVGEVEIATVLRHRNLATVFPLTISGELLLYAQEYTEGESLGAYLAEHRSVGPAEALQIVDQLAAALEVGQAAGLRHRNLHPHAVILGDDDAEPEVKLTGLALPATMRTKDALADFPGEQLTDEPWNAHSCVHSLGALLFQMLTGFGRSSLPPKGETSGQSLSDNLAIPASVVPVLAASIKSASANRIASLAELRELLAAALRGVTKKPGPHQLGTFGGSPTLEVIHRIERPHEAEPQEKSPVESGPVSVVESPVKSGSLTIPIPWLAFSAESTLLHLAVDGPDPIEYILSGRDGFRLGRSKVASCDFVTRFLPRNPVNDRRTQRLSKTQTVAKWEEGRVALYDGDGSRNSVNGSTFDDTPLTPTEPTFVEKSGTLLLAGEYPIRVIPLLAKPAADLRIANLAKWKGPAGDVPGPAGGAVVFMSDDVIGAKCGVWLLSSVVWGSTADQPVSFDPDAYQRATGAFHRFRGCFWLECRLADALTVNGVRIAPGEIVPLVSGQIINAEGRDFRVE